MRKRNFARVSLLLMLAFRSSPQAQADVQTIVFSQKQIDAVQTLLQVDKTHIYLNKRHGVFTPGPGLRFLGMPVDEFDVPLSGIANVADLQFKNINSMDATLRLQGGSFEVQVDFEPNGLAVSSVLGTVSVDHAAILARISPITASDGNQTFQASDSKLLGTLHGTGIFQAKPLQEAVRHLALTLLKQRLDSIFGQARLQENISNALLTWAGAYTGERYSKVLKGSIRVENGILSYQVEN